MREQAHLTFVCMHSTEHMNQWLLNEEVVRFAK